MINNRIYQEIFDELGKYLPSRWEKLIVYLEFGNASYSFSFFVKTSGAYVKCFDIPGVDEKDLDASFKRINEMVSKERAKEKGDIWSNMTMSVSATGDMHTDFDYTDLSGGTYQFKKDWKKKYLN